MLPPFRRFDYVAFRACERFNMLPPGITSNKWDELDWWQQTCLIEYDNIRTIEETEEKIKLAGR